MNFGVPAQGGTVSSGKPLTSRRLSAICESAKIYDTSNLDLGAYKQKVGVILQEQFGIKTTLNLTNEQLHKLTEKNPALEVYAGIEKSIDFLQKDFKDFFIEKPDYNVAKLLNEDLGKYTVRFQIKDLETGKYEDMRPLGIMENLTEQRKHSPSSALFAALRGNLLHTERANFNSSKSIDLDPLNKYVEENLKGFIKNGVDAYFEAKMNGKVGELMLHLKTPGACTEEKSMRFYEFRQENFQGSIDTKLEVELNSTIRKSESMPLDKLISAEFEDIDKQHPEFETWEEYATELKNRLVGLKRPMVTMTENNGKVQFDVKKDFKGNTEIRAITPKDIDTIGEKLYHMIYEGA